MRWFWDNVEKSDGCWIWTASTRGGYGRLWIDGGNVDAHRVSWEMANGPIPGGMCVCHHCDVRACVNPAHLFLGTHADNRRDCVLKGRTNAPAGEEHHNAKLLALDVRMIRLWIKRGHTGAAIGRAFGVSRSLVSLIGLNKLWRET